MNIISKYRTELMGLAIIWVILYHILLTQNPTPYSFGIFNSIIGNGYGGVDIFIYLSGFGLVRSWNNSIKKAKSPIKDFYIKRLIRLMPAYCIICILFSIYRDSILTFILSFSTIGHWINKGRYDWYVPTILIFYLLFPYIYNITQKFKLKFICIIFVSTMIICIFFNLYSSHEDIRMLSLSRLPIFILGLYHGIHQEKISALSSSVYKYIMMTIGIIILFILKNSNLSIFYVSGIYQLPFFFIVPGLCQLIGNVLHILKNNHLNRLIAIFGMLSYEFYLVHLKLIENIASFPLYSSINKWFFLILLSSIISISTYALHKVAKQITSRITSLTIHN